MPRPHGHRLCSVSPPGRVSRAAGGLSKRHTAPTLGWSLEAFGLSLGALRTIAIDTSALAARSLIIRIARRWPASPHSPLLNSQMARVEYTRIVSSKNSHNPLSCVENACRTDSRESPARMAPFAYPGSRDEGAPPLSRIVEIGPGRPSRCAYRAAPSTPAQPAGTAHRMASRR